MDKSNKIASTRVRFGRRTYFFDVNESKNNTKYLRITESQFMGEGEERIYNSFILFGEEVTAFKESLKEIASSLTA